MFEPMTFPTETAVFSPFPRSERTATLNSGTEVENATRMKPNVVFPSLVMVETLIALVIVKRLDRTSTIKNAARRMKATKMSKMNSP
jgi:chorismate synthase